MTAGRFREIAELNRVDNIGSDSNMSAHREGGNSKLSSIEEWEMTLMNPCLRRTGFQCVARWGTLETVPSL